MTTPKNPHSWVGYAILALVIVGHSIYSLTIGGLDFSVYRAGAMTIFNNEGFAKDLYQIDLMKLSDTFWLPFTYPPFAAMLFVPLAFMPSWLGVTLMLVLSFSVAWWMSTLIYDYANQRGYSLPLQSKLGRTGTIALLTALILLSGPWRRGLGLVQINPLIMLLVMLDMLRPATKVPRGVLIGIAGGIKLTPLAFGLILLMRKDIKGVITLGISFASTVALGFILMPKEAQDFWFSAVSDPSRVGNINYPDNISVLGWLMHLGVPEGPVLKLLQYTLILLLLAATAALLPLLHRRGMVLSEIAVNAFLMMSMSPISWSHHNTWLPLIVLALAVDAFGVFFEPGKAVTKLAKVLSWVSIVGLLISPLWIASAINGSSDDLDHATFTAILIAGIPAICLYLVIIMWAAVALQRRKTLPHPELNQASES
ncbi:glycosyltransferase family 87 protein [Rothia nasisuis]|uniref:glycosyltransferase family 87 protein n=1 Tax=Rothia nasisuis TaxID=2109647 RepID=UPI001F35EEA4|nr:glycosyltransferase family 87 protein [Rothia nasisuis]